MNKKITTPPTYLRYIVQRKYRMVLCYQYAKYDHGVSVFR